MTHSIRALVPDMHGYVLLNAPLAWGRCSICSAAWGNRYILVFDDVTCTRTCIYMYMYICTECVQDCKYRYVYVCVPVSAQGFQYDDLYVTAHLQLPECKFHPTSEPTHCALLSLTPLFISMSVWEVCGTQELSVVTQISRTRSKHLVRTPYPVSLYHVYLPPSLMCSLAHRV